MNMEKPPLSFTVLGKPKKGFRTIAWPHGIKERSMLVEAEDDWSIDIAIDWNFDPEVIYCVVKSKENDFVRITEMENGKLPVVREFSGDDLRGIGGAKNRAIEEIIRSSLAIKRSK